MLSRLNIPAGNQLNDHQESGAADDNGDIEQSPSKLPPHNGAVASSDLLRMEPRNRSHDHRIGRSAGEVKERLSGGGCDRGLR